MSGSIIIKDKIQNFKKIINVSGDKSISIRWVLMSSLANGVSTAKNLLLSEDVFAAINAIKKLGIKTKFNKNKSSESFTGRKHNRGFQLWILDTL